MTVYDDKPIAITLAPFAVGLASAVQWANQHAIDRVTFDDVKSAFPASTTSSTTRNPEMRA